MCVPTLSNNLVKVGVSQRWLSELEAGKGKQINERYFAVLGALGIHLRATVSDD